MSGSSDDLPGDGSSPERILLLVQAGRDRDLLEDWLDSLACYAVETRDPGASLPAAGEYDLCLLDSMGLAKSEADIRAHKQEVDPVFLPCLLMIPEQTTETEILSSIDESEDTPSLIDDTVSLPVDQPVLNRRIENLLSARRAALRLRNRQYQYEQLVNLTPEAILILHEDEIVYSNAAATEVFTGTESHQPTDGDDALDGRSVMTLVGAEGRSELQNCLHDIEHSGGTEQFRELTMQTVTGEQIQAEIAGTRITFGDAPATQLLVRDVTEEYERRQQLTLFGRAIQTSVQGVTIADAQQDDEPLIYANAAFEEITGYSTAEVMGRNCRFLQGERTDPETVTRIREAIASRDSVRVEILNYRKDGTPFWNQLDIVPVDDDDGEVTHFLGLQRDITGRKSREERLRVLDRVLRHNLRNRMNVIIGNADRLQAGGESDEVKEIGETIQQAAESLLEISDQIREFNSLLNEKHHDLESSDIVAVLDRVIEGFRSEHPEATVRFEHPKTAMIAAHPFLPAALDELFGLLVEDGDTAHSTDIAVAISTGQERIEVEILCEGGAVSESDLRVIEKEVETPTEHPQGLEPWLIRWTVLNSEGEVSVSRNDGVEITLRFRRWEDNSR